MTVTTITSSSRATVSGLGEKASGIEMRVSGKNIWRMMSTPTMYGLNPSSAGDVAGSSALTIATGTTLDSGIGTGTYAEVSSD